MSAQFRMHELERYLAGDLPADRAALIERAAEADSSLADWLSERRAEASAFERDPRRRSFDALTAEAAPRPRWWQGLGLSGIGLLAATALALFALRPTPTQRSVESGSVESGLVRTRGGLGVRAAVLRNGRASEVASGADLFSGDRLRLSVDDARGGHAIVLLEEDGGAVSVAYTPDELGALPAGTTVLPGSLQLDARLGAERIHVVLCATRPDAASLRADLIRARATYGFGHDWRPPAGCRSGQLHYVKRSP